MSKLFEHFIASFGAVVKSSVDDDLSCHIKLLLNFYLLAIFMNFFNSDYTAVHEQ